MTLSVGPRSEVWLITAFGKTSAFPGGDAESARTQGSRLLRALGWQGGAGLARHATLWVSPCPTTTALLVAETLWPAPRALA